MKTYHAKRPLITLGIFLLAALLPGSANAMSAIGAIAKAIKYTFKIADACTNEAHDKQMYITTNTQLENYDGLIEKTGKDAVGMLNIRISPSRVADSHLAYNSFIVKSDKSAYGYFHRNSGAAESSQMGGIFHTEFIVESTGSDEHWNVYNAVGVFNDVGTSLVSDWVKFDANTIKVQGRGNARAYGIAAGGNFDIPVINNYIDVKSDYNSAYGVYVLSQSGGSRMSQIGAGNEINVCVRAGRTPGWTQESMAAGVYLNSAYLGEIAGTADSPVKITAQNEGLNDNDTAVGVFVADGSNLERGVSYADITAKSQGDFAVGIGVYGESETAHIGQIRDVDVKVSSERGRAVALLFDGNYTMDGSISGSFEVKSHGDVFGYSFGRDVSGWHSSSEGGIAFYNGYTKDSTGLVIDYGNVRIDITSYGASSDAEGNSAYGAYVAEGIKLDDNFEFVGNVNTSGLGYGIYNCGEIGDLNLQVNVFAQGGTAYGIYAAGGNDNAFKSSVSSLKEGGFIRVENNGSLGDAYGIYVDKGASIGNIAADLEVANAKRGYGIYVEQGASVGDISGDIAISSNCELAYGIFNDGGSVGKFSGNFTFEVDGYALVYGKYDRLSDIPVGFFDITTGDSSTFDISSSIRIVRSAENTQYTIHIDEYPETLDVKYDMEYGSGIFLAGGSKLVFSGEMKGVDIGIKATGVGTEVISVSGNINNDTLNRDISGSIFVEDGAKVTDITPTANIQGDVFISGAGSQIVNFRPNYIKGNISISGEGAQIANFSPKSFKDSFVALENKASIGVFDISGVSFVEGVRYETVSSVSLDSGSKISSITGTNVPSGHIFQRDVFSAKGGSEIGIFDASYASSFDAYEQFNLITLEDSSFAGMSANAKIELRIDAVESRELYDFGAIRASGSSKIGDIAEGAEIIVDAGDKICASVYGINAGILGDEYGSVSVGTIAGKISVHASSVSRAYGVKSKGFIDGLASTAEISVNTDHDRAVGMQFNSIGYIAGKISAETMGDVEYWDESYAIYVDNGSGILKFREGAQISAITNSDYGFALYADGTSGLRISGDDSLISLHGNVFSGQEGAFVIESGRFSFASSRWTAPSEISFGYMDPETSEISTSSVVFTDSTSLATAKVVFYANSLEDHSFISVAEGKSLSLANADTVINIVLAENFLAESGSDIMISDTMISDAIRTFSSDSFNVYLGSELLDSEKWSVFNDDRGFGVVFNAAIPEPSAYAALFGALSLVLAACRRRK